MPPINLTCRDSHGYFETHQEQVFTGVEFWSRFPNTPTTDEILILGFASEPERK